MPCKNQAARTATAFDTNSLIAALIGGCSTGNLGAGEAGADRTEKDLARLATGLTLSTINPSTPWNCWKKTASGRLLGGKQQTKSQGTEAEAEKGERSKFRHKQERDRGDTKQQILSQTEWRLYGRDTARAAGVSWNSDEQLAGREKTFNETNFSKPVPKPLVSSAASCSQGECTYFSSPYVYSCRPLLCIDLIISGCFNMAVATDTIPCSWSAELKIVVA